MAYRLLTDRANHHALKGVLAALLSRIPIEIASVSASSERLPQLQGGTLAISLFAPNEIAKFLFTASSVGLEDVSWLEWESTVFARDVAPLYATRTLTPPTIAAFAHLEQHWAQRQKSSSHRSLAEVVVWCSVLPALCIDGLLPDERRSELPHLTQWFEEFRRSNVDAICTAFNQLGVQEEADFLRTRRVFRLSPPRQKPFFSSTPIYYVNGLPHIGHVYSLLIAESVANFHRLKGEEVFICTGTDEHGQKVAQAAQARKLTPFEFATSVSNEFKKCFADMHQSFNHYIRTTDALHEANVQEMWTKLESKGDIYLGKYEGWYCISDEAFVTQQNVSDTVDKKGNPIKVSTESGNPVTWVTEENYMFRLSAFQEPLLKWYRENPSCIVPEFRRQEVIRLVEKGLADLSVSRKREVCDWGVAVPSNPKHTIYVWLDALSNYYTAARISADGKSLEDFRLTNRWPCDLHVVGKDILKFHAVYWPAFLMSAGLPLPARIVAHGWWTKDHMKISKSLGNVFDPVDKAKAYGFDALKYFLLRESSFQDDGDYSDRCMVARLNGELADTLGNLLLRCVSRKLNPAGVWPAPGPLNDSDRAMIQHVSELPGTVDHYFLIPDIQRALIAVFDVLRELNGYTTENAPWKLVKDPTQKVRLDTCMYIVQEGVRMCVTLLSPILVDTAPRMLKQLGVPQELRRGPRALQFGCVAPGTALGPESEQEVFFPKVEMPAATAAPAK